MVPRGSSRSEGGRKTKRPADFLRIPSRPMRCPPLRGGLRCLLNCEGQTLVETAVSLSILFALTIGIILSGLALYSYNFVAESAREGSRFAMVRGSSCTSPCAQATSASVQSYVQNLGYLWLNSSNLTVTTTWPDTGYSCTPSVSPCNNPGNNVMVQVTYLFPWNIPFTPSGTLSLTSTSEVVISQ